MQHELQPSAVPCTAGAATVGASADAHELPHAATTLPDDDVDDRGGFAAAHALGDQVDEMAAGATPASAWDVDVQGRLALLALRAVDRARGIFSGHRQLPAIEAAAVRCAIENTVTVLVEAGVVQPHDRTTVERVAVDRAMHESAAIRRAGFERAAHALALTPASRIH